MARHVVAAVCLSTLLLSPLRAVSQRLLVFDLKEEIGSTAWQHVKCALSQADRSLADAVLLHMNTYGGEVLFADSIRSALLASPRPVYAYVDINAASAGALIATACDSIFMAPGSTIGACTVVNGADGAKMPDKYQSYMRAMMRSTAEARPWHGPDTTRLFLRDPRVAEAMVDEAVAVPGLVDSAHVLTFTAREARANNYCEGIYGSLDEVAQHVLPGAAIERYQPTLIDDVKGSLLSTGLRGILILIIIGGIYFELQTPGLGFPSLAALAAAILYFAPLYIDGLAANWEVALFVVGVALVAVELFVSPGLLVPGIAGALCIIVALVLGLLPNEGFSFERVSLPDMSLALWGVSLSLVAAVALCVVVGRKLPGMRHSRLFLETTQREQEGYVGVDKSQVLALVGKTGVAATDLRPAGKALVEGQLCDALSRQGFIAKGAAVVVVDCSAAQIVVDAVDGDRKV